ncbi:hypothetical protein NHQ30_001734 [Ciborinia camelliae]|nr:hypothetical protein NHQ30_001734 [Ciborinia camelliae]
MNNTFQPVIMLHELGLPVELKLLSWNDLMSPGLAKINPGGKVPGKCSKLAQINDYCWLKKLCMIPTPMSHYGNPVPLSSI